MDRALKIFSFLMLFPSTLFAADPKVKEGDRVQLDLRLLACTQTSYGALEVQERKAHIMDAWNDPAKRSALFNKEKTEVVIGPEGKPYLINGHHFARAVFELWQEGKLKNGNVRLKIPEIPVTIEKNWHDLKPK